MRARLLLGALVLSTVIPAGLVAANHVVPTCNVATSRPYTEYEPEIPPSGVPSGNMPIGEYYVRVLAFTGSVIVQLWQESNHMPGLQPRDTLCPDNTFYPRDTLVLSCVDTSRPLQCV